MPAMLTWARWRDGVAGDRDGGERRQARVAYLLKSRSAWGNRGQVARVPVCGGHWRDGVVRKLRVRSVYRWSGCPVGERDVDSGCVEASHPVLGSPILAAGVLWAIEPDSAKLFCAQSVHGSRALQHLVGSARHFSTPAATDGFVVVPAGNHVMAFSTGS